MDQSRRLVSRPRTHGCKYLLRTPRVPPNRLKKIAFRTARTVLQRLSFSGKPSLLTLSKVSSAIAGS